MKLALSEPGIDEISSLEMSKGYIWRISLYLSSMADNHSGLPSMKLSSPIIALMSTCLEHRQKNSVR